MKIPRCRLLISLLPVSPTFLTAVYVISYTVVDKQLVDVPREKIRQQLIEVGFDDVRQADMVGGLSGGWKMKLELARAMLYNADLLLLDEVCFPKPEAQYRANSRLNSLPITYAAYFAY